MTQEGEEEILPSFFPSMVSQKTANVKGVKMKYLKKFLKGLILMLNQTEEVRKNVVNMGLVDFGGQGRNKYGR